MDNLKIKYKLSVGQALAQGLRLLIKSFNENDHPRKPAGSTGGGQFSDKNAEQYTWRSTFQVMPEFADVKNETEAVAWYRKNLEGQTLKRSVGFLYIAKQAVGFILHVQLIMGKEFMIKDVPKEWHRSKQRYKMVMLQLLKTLQKNRSM